MYTLWNIAGILTASQQIIFINLHFTREKFDIKENLCFNLCQLLQNLPLLVHIFTIKKDLMKSRANIATYDSFKKIENRRSYARYLRLPSSARALSRQK